MSAIRDLYEEALSRYNAGDVDGFARTHAKDVVLVTPATTAYGRAGIRSHWTRVRAAYPDHLITLDRVLEQDDLLAAEWTWVGTNTGPLLRGGREQPPTCRRVELKGMDLVRVARGEFAEYHVYWDGTAIARQLRVPLL